MVPVKLKIKSKLFSVSRRLKCRGPYFSNLICLYAFLYLPHLTFLEFLERMRPIPPVLRPLRLLPLWLECLHHPVCLDGYLDITSWDRHYLAILSKSSPFPTNTLITT